MGYDNSIQANPLTGKQISPRSLEKKDLILVNLSNNFYASHTSKIKVNTTKKTNTNTRNKHQKRVQKLVLILSMAASGKKI